MVYWYFTLVGKRRDIVPVIKRLLAPRLIIERVICRCIHGKTHRAYLMGPNVIYAVQPLSTN